MGLLDKFWDWMSGSDVPTLPELKVEPDGRGIRAALEASKRGNTPSGPRFPIQPPVLPKTVGNGKNPVMAMDSDGMGYGYGDSGIFAGLAMADGFPGYAYLAMLATRAEYRAFAASMSREITREWLSLNSSETAGDETKDRIAILYQRIKDCGLRRVVQEVCEHDFYYGRGQILIDVEGHDMSIPLTISSKTIKKGSKFTIRAIEPMWTTPADVNMTDPSRTNYYKPDSWWIFQKKVDSSRLRTIITRPVPDILKPAYNFSGVSMSQLAEPYVNNWLRTRQSVSDLINNFSIITLKTNMSAVLMGGEGALAAGDDLINRAMLFSSTRSNKGLMMLDKEAEELGQTAVPLGSLDALQAQAQEHMCAVSRMPAVVLTGLSPSGLNVSTDGEMGAWRDWVAGEQESFYNDPVVTVINILQIIEFGEIDPDIHIGWNPLFQMSAKEKAEIRLSDAQAGQIYIQNQVISPEDDRERLARDPESGYQGLQLGIDIGEVEDDDEVD